MSESDWKRRYEDERRERERAEARLHAVRLAQADLERHVAELQEKCQALSIAVGQLGTDSVLAESSDPAGSEPAVASETSVEEEATTGKAIVAMSGGDREQATEVLVSAGLTVDGFTVDAIDDGERLVDAVIDANPTEAPYVIVLLDMTSAQLDGTKIVRQLRRRGYCGVVLALTRGASEADTTPCLEAGCDDYLAAPIQPRRLLRKVQRAIAQVSLDL